MKWVEKWGVAKQKVGRGRGRKRGGETGTTIHFRGKQKKTKITLCGTQRKGKRKGEKERRRSRR